MTIIFLGDGITVFAPTNAAFNKLGSHVLDNLRRDPQLLKGIAFIFTFVEFCNVLLSMNQYSH